MKVLLTGDGARAAELFSVMTAHPGTSVAAVISRSGTATGVPVHATVESAPGAAVADVIVFAGDLDPVTVASAASTGLPVLVVSPAWSSQAALRELLRMAEGGAVRVYLARDPGYADCFRTLAKYINGGRVGSIGHVAIEDCGPFNDTSVDAAGYWFHRAGPLLIQACELFGTTAKDVMARVDAANGVTEAYVATRRGIHLHYAGRWNASVDSHSFWIEGTQGSLKADHRAVWWRKRGWRFFVPVHTRGVAKAATLGESWRRLAAGAARLRGPEHDGAAFAMAFAALLSTGSREGARVAAGTVRPAAASIPGSST